MADESGIVVEITAAIAGLLSGMQEAASAVSDGAAEITGSLETIESGARAAMAPIIALTAAFEAFHVLTDSVKNIEETGEQLRVMSEKTGMSVEALSRLEFAGKMTSVSTEAMETSFTRLAKNMEEAVRVPTSRAALAFHDLGLKVDDGKGHLLGVQDVLTQVANRLSTMGNETEKVAYLTDVFGRGGAALLPMLEQGAAGIKKLADESDRLGATWSEKDVEASEQFRQTIVALKAQWDAMIRSIVIDGFSGFERLLHYVSAVKDEFEAWAWVLRSVMDVWESLMHPLTADFDQLADKLQADQDKMNLLAAQASKEATLGDQHQDAPFSRTGAGGTGSDPTIHATTAAITVMEKYQEALDKLKIANAADYADMDKLELKFWQDKLSQVKAGSKDYIEILGRISQLSVAVARQNAEEQQKDQKTLSELDDQFTKAQLDNYEKRVAALKAEGELHRDDLKLQLSIAEQLYILAGNQYGLGSKEQLAALGDFNKVSNQIATQMTKTWIAAFDTINKSYSQTVQQMQKTGGTLLTFSEVLVEKIVRNFIVGEIKKLEAKTAAWMATKMLDKEGNQMSVEQSAIAAIKLIGHYAAVAAAGAWSALEGVPYIGPILAPAAAVAALAGVLALGHGLASAAGGYDIPAGVNPITQLHAQEMVLPASLANSVRSMASGGGGGGGGDTHLHVHTMDAKGVATFMNKHKSAVATATHNAARAGIAFRAQPGRNA